MFGDRYYGPRYYGDRYFGTNAGGGGGPAPDTDDLTSSDITKIHSIATSTAARWLTCLLLLLL